VETTSTLRYTWDWTREEHLRLHRALSRHAAARIWINGVLAVVGLFAAFAIVVAFVSRTAVLPVVLPWALVLGVWTFILKWWPPRASARAHARLHRGPQRLELTDEALENRCDVCSSRLRWEAFKRAVETPDFFFVFYTPNCAVYLPKRVLGGGDQLRHVRDVLRTHLQDRAALLAD
jgi:hypothetical protein